MRHVHLIAPMVALVMFGWVLGSVAKAEDAKGAKGTIQGKVVDKDGKAVAGANVAVFVPDAEEKKESPTPIVTAVTDDKGEFTISIAAGNYLLTAHKPKVGGSGRKITVTADKATSVRLILFKSKNFHRGRY